MSRGRTAFMMAMKMAARSPLSKRAARMKNVPAKNNSDRNPDSAQVLALKGGRAFDDRRFLRRAVGF